MVFICKSSKSPNFLQARFVQREMQNLSKSALWEQEKVEKEKYRNEKEGCLHETITF